MLALPLVSVNDRFETVTVAEFVCVIYPGAEISHHTVVDPTSVRAGDVAVYVPF